MLVEDVSSFRVEVTVTTTVVPARFAVDVLTVISLPDFENQPVKTAVGLYVSDSVGVEQAASGIATVKAGIVQVCAAVPR